MGVILEKQGLENLIDISVSLKNATIDYCNQKDKNIYSKYSPWLCIRPVIDSPIPINLLKADNFPKASLITDSDYLKLVTSFIADKGNLLIKYIPGSAEDWRILENFNSLHSDKIELYQKALEIIKGTSSYLDTLFNSIVEYVIPLSKDKLAGYSSHFARGVIFRTFPSKQSPGTIALDLVHELGHQALMLIQSVDELIVSDKETPVYSEIRKRNRPAIQTFHATAALVYMYILSSSMLEKGIELEAVNDRNREYGMPLKDCVIKSLESLEKKCSFSTVGKAIFEEFYDLVND